MSNKPVVEFNSVPVITLDGPGGVGKGTIGLRLARRLNWHFLDSGVLYRVLAWEANSQGLSLEEESTKLLALVANIKPVFQLASDLHSLKVFWRGRDITDEIRTEECSIYASKIAVYPQVRTALLACQRAFRQAPGLVADGRDMGSIVFSDALFKFFLTASATQRAHRRYLQLKRQGNHASLGKLRAAMLQRDRRDQTRSVAALKAAADACIIDTTQLSVDQVFSIVWDKLSNLKNLVF